MRAGRRLWAGRVINQHVPLNLRADLVPGRVQIVIKLEAQPELGGRAEEAGQAQSGIGRNPPPAVNNLFAFFALFAVRFLLHLNSYNWISTLFTSFGLGFSRLIH